MIEQAVAAFVQEAQDILLELEDQILGLEEEPSSTTIDAIFRGLHTVKGSGAMFGYTALARFTHHFENAYELVRSGNLAVDKQLIDLSLDARDQMAAFLALGSDGPESEALSASDSTAALIARIHTLAGTANEAPSLRASLGDGPSTSGEAGSALPERFRIRFRPMPQALRNGMRPDLLVRELGELGRCNVAVDISEVPALEDLDPAEACMTWLVDLETQKGRDAIEEVFIFADDADLDIGEMPEEALSADASSADAGEAADTPSSPASVGAEADRQRTDLKKREDAAKVEPKSENIRVASSRLDDMMDSLGELVIAQARLDAVAETLGDATLDSVVEEVGRLVLGLRDATLSIRMLPIETVFGKFRRVVRDLSSELGKDVRLITLGGETEVDKNVIDRIGDPLVHMIRNSIDHGLETASERRAADKSNQATVVLSARQEGGEILISIEDNGRGLNRDRIRSKAIERGLIEAEAELSDRELHQLIFEPGFSTAQEISSVSGRGVGMDAVRNAIDALGGSVDVISRTGRGTRVTLRLPVTMAIIDGLRVRLGASIYVLPLSVVEECVEMDDSEKARQSGRSVLQIREQLVPYLELERLFGIASTAETRRRVVVVRVDGARVGLVVDDILGQSQTVIKSLSTYHKDIPGLGGATILGDGRVALIIDVATLVRWAEARHGETIRKVA